MPLPGESSDGTTKDDEVYVSQKKVVQVITDDNDGTGNGYDRPLTKAQVLENVQVRMYG